MLTLMPGLIVLCMVVIPVSVRLIPLKELRNRSLLALPTPIVAKLCLIVLPVVCVALVGWLLLTYEHM